MAEIQELIEQIESDDNQDSAHIFHQLLTLAMTITGRGDIGEDYTKTIEFPIGDATIISDLYYGRISIDNDDEEEEIGDEEDIELVSEEIKKRILKFDKKIREIREKTSDEIFDKPLKRLHK